MWLGDCTDRVENRNLEGLPALLLSSGITEAAGRDYSIETALRQQLDLHKPRSMHAKRIEPGRESKPISQAAPAGSPWAQGCKQPRARTCRET